MIPFETIAALFPRVTLGAADERGAVALRPPTLAHVAAMEALGVDLDEQVRPDNSLVAAWVLSTPSREVETLVCDRRRLERGFSKWMRRSRFRLALRGGDLDPSEVAKRVNAHLRTAFLTIVEGAKDGDARNFIRTGLGWALELAEWYAHEYAQAFDDALHVPLARLFALIACARQRNGLKHGAPDYFERMEMDGVKECLDRLRAAQEAARKSGRVAQDGRCR